MKVPPSIEARYIDCLDDQLRKLIGEYHEKLTRLKEALKRDNDIGKLKDEIKKIENTMYKPDIRRAEVHLEAVRNIGKERGIDFE